MLDAASDAKDTVSLNRQPHLPPTDWDAAVNLPPPPTDSDAAAGRDEDAVADAAVALLLDSIQEDVDPPSCRSRREEHQGTWDLRPSAEDICNTTTGAACPGPPVLEPHEEVCELERVSFMWF